MSPLPHEGAFAFLRLKLNDLVHTLGGFLRKNLNKKSKKKIHINGKCKEQTNNMITGIARIFQQGAKARERSDRVGEWWGNFLHIKFFV